MPKAAVPATAANRTTVWPVAAAAAQFTRSNRVFEVKRG